MNKKLELYRSIIVGSFLLFIAISYNILNAGSLIEIDRWISAEVVSIQSGTLTKIVVFITNVNGMFGSAIISALLLVYLLYNRYYDDLKFYILTFLGSMLLFIGIKLLVERTRPLLKLINEQGFSFPSGHSTMSMAMALSIYFIFINKIPSYRGRVALLLFAMFWPILIAFTRVYLNVHWLSDVVAGLTLGIFWVTVVLIFTLRRK
jgi:undecaprenyl-diphosphatase